MTSVKLFTRLLCGGCILAKAELAARGMRGGVKEFPLDLPALGDGDARAVYLEARAEYEMVRLVNNELPLFVIDHPTGMTELTNDVQRVIEFLGSRVQGIGDGDGVNPKPETPTPMPHERGG